MNEDADQLARAARQLIDTDDLLGGGFLPAEHHPLPEVQTSAPAAGAEAPAEMTPAQKAAMLKALDEEEVRTCTLCGLHRTRTHTVFGEGDPSAALVFVGEGPGADEDATGRPFVGRAGELLTKMIEAMGLTRQDVFICNMVKCRPPGNRTPAPDEIAACWSYLIRQLQIIRPKVLVTLGNPSTQGLLNTRVGITRLRGQWQKLPELAPGLGGIDVMPTFHPSYVLRQYTPDVRGKVWSDLQAVMKHLGLAPAARKGATGR
ncbi:MAG TPA: uracil-DNA glycosylase [Phycisphaerae bacterium]|nr:uracil-DNA glycosylase [Phycisphaerae bacterium]